MTYMIEDVKKTYLDYFKGREDYFAFQGSDFYKPINQTLSEYYLERHLKGLVTFGIYVLTKNSNCNFICLDIDIPKDKLDSVDFRDPQQKFAYLKEKLFELKNIFENELEISEDALLLEDTGGRGYHIWLFFEEPIKGEDAIRLYKIIRNFTDFDFEFFPKQPSLNRKRKLGNLIKLPLGTHQAYNAQSSFFKIVDSTIVFSDSWQRNFEYLRNLKKISKDKIDQLLGRYRGIFKDDKIEKFSEEDIPDIERIYYGGELNHLFQNCNALNDLKIKAEKGIELPYSEMFHFTNILLSVEGSEEFLLQKIQQSYGPKFSFDYAKTEIEKIKQLHPTSCNKLIEQGICRGYCNDTIKEQNLDPMRPNTNPLSFWLTPIKSKLSIKNVDLIDKISDLENIKNAYWKLKKYHKTEDALFYDEFDFEHFEKDMDIHIRYISSFIKNKEELPFIGYLKVEIPKKVNEDHEMQYRQMAYSNIFDQVIIQSIFNIVSIIFEEIFQTSSYGYRFNIEKLNSEDIFCDWREFYPQFKSKVLDQNRKPDIKYRISCDIKGYYDNIRHDILLQQIKTYIHDDYILKMLEKIIKLYRFDENKEQGLPQGPAYARILANLYLNDFDKEIMKYTSGYFRYVDDLFLFFKNKAQAENGLEKTIERLKDQGLQLSDDEKKKPKIIEVSDEEELVETLDSLRYGIFEEFRFIDYLDVEEVYDFYSAIERHQASTSNIGEILKINDKLPSIIYLISKEFDFSLPIEKKIPAIVEYLVENRLFYPKRLKYIFYQIIHLMNEENYDILKLFQQLHDSHKIYFLLTLFGIYKQQGKYEAELREMVMNGLNSDDYFVKGYAIRIAKEFGLQSSFLNPDFLNDVLECDSYFPKLKLFDTINFFELPSEQRAIFHDKLAIHSAYLGKKYFLSNIEYKNAQYIDNKFLSNLLVSDGHLLLAECCKIFTSIKDQNNLFSELEKFLINHTKYKVVSIFYLKTLVFEINKNSSEAVLDNLIQLYDKIEDKEINRELTGVLKRIKNVVIPSKEEFYKNHNRINTYNECFYFENLDKENTTYKYIELIPYDKLKAYQFDDLTMFRSNLTDLSCNKVLPEINFEYDSTQSEVFIKYSLPDGFEELNAQSYSMNESDILNLLEITENLFKKADYFYKVFNTVPLINIKNLFFNRSKKEVLFKNFGTVLCPNYTIDSNVIRTNEPKEIPKMLSLLLQDILFQNDEEKIGQFVKSSKVGIKLFLSYFITRMASSKDPSLRHSYSRFRYLIELIKEKNVESHYEISLLFFNERLKTNLFNKNQHEIQWLNICNSLYKFYEDLAITYDSINFDEIDYHNKIFMNFSLPRNLHHLSILLLNISLNLEKNLKNSSQDHSYVNLFDLLNYYAMLCIELISFVKISIKSTSKLIQHFSTNNKITLEMGDYSLDLDINDIEVINVLLTREKNRQDIFDRSSRFSLKQISFLCLVKIFEITIRNDNLTIQRNDRLNKRYFDILAYNFLVRLPKIEMKMRECVQKVITDLKTNQDFELSDTQDDLKQEILFFTKEINSLRRKLKYKRYQGRNVKTNRWPPKIHCRSTFWNSFKTESQALSMIPLINTYPSTTFRCSWDVSGKEVINIVIPNERIKKLILKLRKGKIFTYRLKYLYSEKAKLLWDIAFMFLFIILSLATNVSILEKAFYTLTVSFFVKSLTDIKYWSQNFYRIIEYLKS